MNKREDTHFIAFLIHSLFRYYKALTSLLLSASPLILRQCNFILACVKKDAVIPRKPRSLSLTHDKIPPSTAGLRI
jgi:hypothetical protein